MKVGFVAAVLYVCCFSPAVFGQQAKLEGHVFDHHDKRVRAARIIAPGGQAAETDSRGHFAIIFPSSISPGQATRIEIARPGWVIFEPMMGNCVTQSAARNYEPLKVIIVPRGSPLALSPRRLAQVIAQWADERAKLRGQVTRYKSQVDGYAFLREYAEKYGFTLDRFLEAAQQWARNKDSSNQEVQALKEYLQNNYDRAAYLAHKSALAAAAELEEAHERRIEASGNVIRRFQLEGNAFFEQNKFREALTAYGEVDRRFTSRQLSKEDFIREWAEIKVLVGNAKRELGTTVEGRESQQLLAEAVTEYRQALTASTREHTPELWAVTQNSLGITLASQGERLEGEAGVRLLEQAAEAFRAALQVETGEHTLQDWAGTLSNLGNTLGAQGERLGGEAGARLLAQAVEAYHAALRIFTRKDMPQLWAMTQTNLGIALGTQGEDIRGEAGVRLLEQAAEAGRAALQVYTRENTPHDWARTQNSLGITLRAQGKRLGGEAGARLLEQAIEAYRAALQVYTREQTPQQWAMTQNNLGVALASQAERLGGEAGARLLEQAAEAFRVTLRVFTREHMPKLWATAQGSLGGALFSQGMRLKGADRARLLEQAVEAGRAALQVYTRENTPQQWAGMQKNLARTYIELNNWLGVAEAHSNLLKLYPDDEDAYILASGLYQWTFFRFDEAYALNQQWLAHHPGDISAQSDFAEKHFTTGRFAECVQRIDTLLLKSEVDDSTKIVLRAIEIASLLALKQNNLVPVKMAALIEEVSRQPEDLEIDRTFEDIKHFIGQNEQLLPHRGWLGQLFDALAGEDRDTILNGLRQTAVSFKE